MKKLIKVEQKHINNCKSNYDGTSCPIALALKESLGTQDVEVGHSFYEKDTSKILIKGSRIEGPRSTRRFINKIDNGRVSDPVQFSAFKKQLKPFNFWLELPDDAI